MIQLTLKIGRWPLLFLAVSFAIALIYRFVRSCDKPQWRWITPGSVFAAWVWLGASLLFSWYTANFGSYNETYGSLGAAIGFMMWLTALNDCNFGRSEDKRRSSTSDSTSIRPQVVRKPLGEARRPDG